MNEDERARFLLLLYIVTHVTGTAQPILVSLGARSLSVATLVVVSDVVDFWVALRFPYH